MEGRDLLKAMAQQAKERLAGKNKITSVKYGKFEIIENKPNVKTIIINSNDDALYNKVKDTLNNNSINPLNDLIDFNYYKTLSKEQKERYFFNLADKYRKLKQRYENEKIKEVY